MLGGATTIVVTITDNDNAPPISNVIDEARDFVRQQYYDFLNREPDQGGLDYWTNEITKCGADQNCITRRRADVSAAFFIEREFQDTGFAAYRLYKAMFGRAPTYLEYTKARSQIKAGLTISAAKAQLAGELLSTPEVKQMYEGRSNAEYVDATYANTRIKPNTDERQSLIDALDAETLKRAAALVKIADNQAFVDTEYNAAFVTMQYFGYLRRDADAEGFRFRVEVLNTRVVNNYRAMVCAFITSAECQYRFSPVRTRNNSICGSMDSNPLIAKGFDNKAARMAGRLIVVSAPHHNFFNPALKNSL